MDAETARQWLQEESAWQSFLLSAAYGDSDMAFELLQMNAPEVDWNKRLQENANEKTDIQQTQQKYQAFTELLERVNYAISYEEFLESVKTQAQSMSKLSLFSDVDSFSQKNIQKTAEAYEKMSAVQPGLTYSDAADAWSDSALADVIVPGLLLFLGWAIFRKEKDHCLFLLCCVACHFVIWKSDCTCHFDVWNGRYDAGPYFHPKLSQLPISHKHTAIFDSLFSR